MNSFSKDTKLKMAKELHNIDFLNNEPYEAAQKITQPIFVIHGTKDIHVPIENSEKQMENVQSKEKNSFHSMEIIAALTDMITCSNSSFSF